MAMVKGVSLRLTGDDREIKDKVKSVGAGIEGLRKLADGIKFKLDDKEGQLQFKEWNLKLDKLGKRVARPRVTLDGVTRADLELDRLNLKLDRIGMKNARPGIGMGLAGAVGALGNLATAGSGLINPLTIGLGGLAAIMSGPLIAALLPITLGFGGLAATAVPELEKVWGAVGKGPKALAKLSGPEKGLVGDIKGLKSAFGDLARAVQPEILKGFGTALGIVQKMLPAIRPLMVAAGKAADQFLGSLSNWLSSSSGHKFMSWLETEGPKDIATFGKVLWTMAQVAGRTFSFLRNAGNTWWKNFKIILDLFGHQVPATFENVWHHVTNVFDGMRHDIAHDWDMIWQNTVGRIIRGVGDVGKWFTTLKLNIGNILSGLPGMLFNIGKNVINSLINGLKAAAGPLISFVNWVKGLVSSISGFFGLGGGTNPHGTTPGGGSGVVSRFAAGGWIREPVVGLGLRTGMGYALAENGPEYVSPRGHGGGNIYITVQGDTDPYAAARRIQQELRKYKRQVLGGKELGIA